MSGLGTRVSAALSGPVGTRLATPLGSLLVSVRRREPCLVRYDGTDWIHRYPDGTVVRSRLGGGSASILDRAARDTFLYGYVPGPGDVVLDIGAGTGEEVRVFAGLVGDTGRVVCVEAHPRTYRCLTKTVVHNRLANVSTVHCAVTDRPGPVFISDDEVAYVSNSLTDAGHGVGVPGRPLTEILARAGVDHVDLLKLNIEGAEYAVLAAALEVLPTIANLVVSCHDFKADRLGAGGPRTFAAVTELLGGAGFAVRTRPADRRRPWLRDYVYASR
ncbi:MAG TPA: FkbM family methyltransferase [Pilimelia sp.]|nr:FkbM family methyltransferase [Pilimelia sp.]